MTQQQIIQGILEGREFMYATMRYKFEATSHRLLLDDRDKWVESEIMAGEFLFLLMYNEITLVPTPPEPLSDEMGELLWALVSDNFLNSGTLDRLNAAGLANGSLITQKGKYLLGQWLMEKNKEAV